MTQRIRILVCSLIGLCCSLAVNAAPPKDTGKAIADDAAVAFKEQRFEQAAELFEKAYALGSDKIVRLRNAGRAWEEAGKLEYARTQFQKYLDKVKSGPDHDEVAQRLERLEARIAAEKAPKPEPTPVTPQLEPEHTPALPTIAVPTPVVAQPPAGEGKWLSWTLVGAGSALMAGGVAWFVATESANNRLTSQQAQGLYSDQKLSDDRSVIIRNRIGAAAVVSAGAAGVVVGVILATKAPTNQVFVTPTAGGMAIAWSRGF
jgi:tetratricopeptide (TPR) repeat protein